MTSEDHGKYLLACAGENKGDLVELLLRAGVDVNWADRTGETALFKAYQRGNIDLCQLLLESGADSTLKNAAGLIAGETVKGPVSRDCSLLFARRRSLKAARGLAKSVNVRTAKEQLPSADGAASPLNAYLNRVPKKADNPREISNTPCPMYSLAKNKTGTWACC